MMDIIEAKYISDCKFELTFENGEKGVADLSAYERRGGVFARFAEPGFIQQAYVNPDIGTICW
ncbi:MAG: DUF2442 domain-containing protein, partial [Elusimicrobia bacterium]|nr:DUF2442 domain-containing protein [Elusimicrobiota bacterium]